jgi:hypothetical protein
MARKQFECLECDAVFKIKHDMDESYYQVTYCAFCGTEIDEEQQDDFGEDEDLS